MLSRLVYMSHTMKMTRGRTTISITGNPDLSGTMRIVSDDRIGGTDVVELPGKLLRQWFEKYLPCPTCEDGTT